ILQQPSRLRSNVFAAVGIDEHPHADTGPGALRQCSSKPTTEFAVLPEESLEVYGTLRSRDVGQQEIEESAVLHQFDGVAVDEVPVRQACDGGEKLRQRRIGMDAEMRVAAVFEGVDDQQERDQQQRDEK